MNTESLKLTYDPSHLATGLSNRALMNTESLKLTYDPSHLATGLSNRAAKRVLLRPPPAAAKRALLMLGAPSGRLTGALPPTDENVCGSVRLAACACCAHAALATTVAPL
jgi:hypothetical protein